MPLSKFYWEIKQEESDEIKATLAGMKIGDSYSVGNSTYTRVPGGWVFTNYSPTYVQNINTMASVFIPFPFNM